MGGRSSEAWRKKEIRVGRLLHVESGDHLDSFVSEKPGHILSGEREEQPTTGHTRGRQHRIGEQNSEVLYEI